MQTTSILINPLRTDVYFCHQNQNAKNIGNFTTLLKPHWYSFERYWDKISGGTIISEIHFWVSYITFWNFLKIASVLHYWKHHVLLCISILTALVKHHFQVQIRLCSHASPAEELALKDDLTLLFSAITSWCPPHNVPWRKSSAEVLMTLSRHGLTPSVVQYIHGKHISSHVDTNFEYM
jgi:hypothetical protein